jgi:hypothetical protein
LLPAPLVQASPLQLANPHSSAPVAQYGLVQRLKLLRATIVALVAIVVSLVTMVAYFEFGNAGQQTHEHIRQQLRERGQLISNSLRPALDNAELKDMPRLSAALKGHADGVQAIRLLFAPGGGERFYYAASWPDAGENFEAQRQHLVGLGILGRLPASCHNGIAFELLSSGPTADREAVAVNPLWTPLGCWVVVTSFVIDSFRGAQETPAS